MGAEKMVIIDSDGQHDASEIPPLSLNFIMNKGVDLARSEFSLSEYLVPIKIEKLEEGVYLATSDTLQGLVAQGRTIAETMEIAQDVARKLIESCIEHGDPLPDRMAPATRIVRNIKIPVAIRS